jgi:ThiF family/Nitroreductase family
VSGVAQPENPAATAEILDEHTPELEALLDDPAIHVLDPLPSLIDKLAELRHIDQQILDEPARWAYFPWRRTVVHLLGPRGFRTLRLDRNRNKITVAEQERFRNATIGVVGLSVGHTIAHTLALEGLCGELRLADFDEIELSNLNRIPATVLDLGINKAVVAARRISEIDPYLRLILMPEGFGAGSADIFMQGLDLVIDECDSLDMKLVLREAARARSIPVIMETSDRGLLDVERFDLEPARQPFHGLLGSTKSSDLAGLSTHDKVPYVLAILEPAMLSARMAASMAEIDYTLSTWPQLGGDVTLGGATVAAAVRRLLRDDPLPSGRVRFDVDAAMELLAEPSPPAELPSDEATAGEGEYFEPPEDSIAAILHAASLAPSGGNAQPWEFALDGDRITMSIAPERTSRMDVRFRGSYVAIGAALHNARVAAARRGRLGSWRIVAREASVEAAVLELGSATDAELADEYDAVLNRRTNRRVGPQRGLDQSFLDELDRVAGTTGGRVRVVDDRSQVEAIAALLGESDRLRYLTEQLHAEMMSELRWPPDDPLDVGLDVRTLDLDRTDLAKLQVARRADVMACLAEWGGGEALGETTRDRVGAASGVVVITVEGAGPADYVRGGMALQRCWLAADRLDIGLQPVSPVFLFALDDQDLSSLVSPSYMRPLAELRDRFRAQMGLGPSETMIVVLRATHAPRPSVRSHRLPLEAVTTHSASTPAAAT